MGGNALEWVNAAWEPYEGNKAPTLLFSKDEIVFRGGGFSTAADTARVSYRNHLLRVFPKGKSVPIGIRCVVPANDRRIQPLLEERNK